MTIQEALNKVKSICFSHLHELQKEADAVKNTSKETAKALEYESQQLSKAMHILTKYVSDLIDDGK